MPLKSNRSFFLPTIYLLEILALFTWFRLDAWKPGLIYLAFILIKDATVGLYYNRSPRAIKNGSIIQRVAYIFLIVFILLEFLPTLLVAAIVPSISLIVMLTLNRFKGVATRYQHRLQDQVIRYLWLIIVLALPLVDKSTTQMQSWAIGCLITILLFSLNIIGELNLYLQRKGKPKIALLDVTGNMIIIVYHAVWIPLPLLFT